MVKNITESQLMLLTKRSLPAGLPASKKRNFHWHTATNKHYAYFSLSSLSLLGGLTIKSFLIKLILNSMALVLRW